MYIHTCFVVADEGDRVLRIPVCDNKELMKLRDMLYFDIVISRMSQITVILK